MSAGGGDGGGVEEGAVSAGWDNAGIIGEDGGDREEICAGRRGELTGIGFELAGFIAVDELEGEGDVAAVLTRKRFGAITDGQLGVFGPSATVGRVQPYPPGCRDGLRELKGSTTEILSTIVPAGRGLPRCRPRSR